MAAGTSGERLSLPASIGAADASRSRAAAGSAKLIPGKKPEPALLDLELFILDLSVFQAACACWFGFTVAEFVPPNAFTPFKTGRRRGVTQNLELCCGEVNN